QLVQEKAAQSTAETFVSDLKLARSEAIKRGVPVELCGVKLTTVGGKPAYECLPAASRDWTPEGWMVMPANAQADQAPIRVQAKPRGVGSVTAGLPSGQASFKFNPNGILAATPGNLVIIPGSNDALARKICVGMSGTPRIKNDQRDC